VGAGSADRRRGEPVVAVMAFLRELQASGRSAATQRLYAMDLLRWFRFGWAIDVGWDQATRVEARDFCRWLALRDKPVRAGAGRRRVVPNALPANRSVTEVRRVDPGALGDGATGVLRLPPRRRNEPDGQPVPAVPGTVRWPGACPPHNPMEPFRNERWGSIDRVSRSGSRALSPTSCSTG
jgi:hypothetical protein